MKKFLILLPLLAVGFGVFCLSLSCSTKSPLSPNNFQTPVIGIVAINPTLTFTPTFTYTVTSTFTPPPTATPTTTPYATATIIPWINLKNPTGIAVDSNGYVYVADTGNNRVGKYTSNGVLVASWGSGGVKGKISITSPVGLALDGSDDLYAIVSGSASVSEFNSNGSFVSAFNAGTFSNPQGVALDSVGNIYVSDAVNNRMVQLTSGNSAGTGFGGSGIFNLPSLPVSIVVGSVTLNGPVTLSGLAVNGSTLYAATQGANVISGGVTYSALLAIDIPSGNITDVIPGFNNPTGVAFDPSGNLWVADTGNKQIVEFQAGRFNQVPIANTDGGLLKSPVGVAVDASGNIYVTDSILKQVIKFAP